MSPTRLSKIETALRTVLAFNKAFNDHDIPAILALLSEDCRFESAAPAPEGEVITGKAAIEKYFQNLFTTYPQIQLKTEDAFGLGYHCIARWTLTWTGPGGKAHHLRGADIYKVDQHLITEKYSYIKGKI
jgi:ketosteroid isomerase-like protein